MSTLVLDLGGTWIRSALFHDNYSLSEVNKCKLNWTNSNLNFNQKLEKIFIDLKRISRQYKEKVSINKISISAGMCINHFNGDVYYSAPLFGDERVNFNFKEALENSYFNKPLIVINDVSALCYGLDALGFRRNYSQFAVLTISSGIALRRYDVINKKIFFDSVFGIQGEIGHIPILNPFFKYDNKPICACGGESHFAAYSSGKGLDNIFDNYLIKDKLFFDTPLGHAYRQKKISVLALKDILLSSPDQVDDLLNIIVYPIAQAIAMLFSFCPEVECLFICGGLIEALNIFLIQKIFDLLPKIAYVYDRNFFSERIIFIEKDISLGLIGAGYFASITN